MLRGPRGSHSLGHRRGRGALFGSDAERRGRHRHFVLERFAFAHGRRDPSDQADQGRARRSDSRWHWRSFGAKPCHTTHDAPGCVDWSGAAAVACARRGQLVRRAARDGRRSLCPRRDGSVPPTDGRARGHRRAPAIRHARQFRQRLHRRGTARPRRGAARSAISACGSSTAKDGRSTDRSTSG